MKGITWTQEEVDFLEDKWGTLSIPSIAKKLNRTVYSIKNKAYKIGLTRHIHSSEAVTLHQVLVGLGLNTATDWNTKRFINRGLPYMNKKSINRTYRVIYMDKFWKWLKCNKDLVNFKNFEKNALGNEPGWVDEKRRIDLLAAAAYKKTPWTIEEDNMLKSLLNHYRFSYKEISLKLQRTEGAVKKRMADLKLKARPIKSDNHTPWTQKEIDILLEFHKKGYEPDLIAQKLNIRGAQAVRGKLERLSKEGVI